MAELNIEKMAQKVAEKVMHDLRDNGVCIGRWIPCSERLPEEEVLCCDIQNNIMLGYVFVDMSSESGFSAENDNCYMYECVAWMPKPKGYNGGEKE